MKSFSVVCKRHVVNLEEPMWCFCFGEGKFSTVQSIGLSKRRWWESKEDIISELESLGICSDEYFVV